MHLKLTDRKTTCKAVETRPLPNIDPNSLAPGTTVSISSATLKSGLLLLDPKCLKVPFSSTFPGYQQGIHSRVLKPHLWSTNLTA